MICQEIVPLQTKHHLVEFFNIAISTTITTTTSATLPSPSSFVFELQTTVIKANRWKTNEKKAVVLVDWSRIRWCISKLWSLITSHSLYLHFFSPHFTFHSIHRQLCFLLSFRQTFITKFSITAIISLFWCWTAVTYANTFSNISTISAVFCI